MELHGAPHRDTQPFPPSLCHWVTQFFVPVDPWWESTGQGLLRYQVTFSLCFWVGAQGVQEMLLTSKGLERFHTRILPPVFFFALLLSLNLTTCVAWGARINCTGNTMEHSKSDRFHAINRMIHPVSLLRFSQAHLMAADADSTCHKLRFTRFSCRL